ncbi:MAG: SPW repeat protein [Caldilineaceae bacterium]|nr:SPW repeat protein [Caldilineaceae bacterium]MCB0188225.1 SPW repeat protein [Caldilineaceae bacterium]
MYWLTMILGIAMAIAPYLLGYRDNTIAMWSSVLLGAVVAVVSIYEGMDAKHAKWEWWVVGIAGVVAVLAPFVFGFNTLTMALWTLVVLGILAVILAGYEVFFAEQPV